MVVIKRQGKKMEIDINEIKKSILMSMKNIEDKVETLSQDETINIFEKNIELIILIKIYKKLKSLYKFFSELSIKYAKKLHGIGLFLSTLISKKFKIYNLN